MSKRFICYNPGENIWSKVKKSSKIGYGKKNKKSLISTFACFLTAIARI